MISLVLCVAVVFVGIMLIVQMLDQYSRAKTMAAWPTALGRIMSSGIEPVASDGELRWRPAVRYMYEVRGQSVISTGLSLATARDDYSEAQARQMALPYPPNTMVVVFYNPEHISDAVLDHSLPRFAWLSLFAGLILVSAGGARLLMAHRVFWR
ncbi:MAG TPA: DUF3592 domain-containing protein [Burkholderiales bacterium]